MIVETTILFSTQAEVLRYRKYLASTCENALMGVKVTTPSALIEELWGVWGTRECLVTASQRSMIVNALLARQDAWVRSAGSVSLLANFLRDYLTFLDVQFCDEHAQEFTPTDNDIIAFVRAYEEALTQAGLIEPAQAALQLAPQVKLGQVIVRTQRPLPAYLANFLERVSGHLEEDEFGHLGMESKMSIFGLDSSKCSSPEKLDIFDSVPKCPEYIYLKPKGETAAAFMVDEVIQENRASGKADGLKVVVTAPDSKALFDAMKDALVQQGLIVSLRSVRSVQDTFFGRTYNAVVALRDPAQQLTRETMLQAAATYVASPYAQLSQRQQAQLMAAFRGDRMLSVDEVCNTIRAASRPFEYFESLIEESDADVLFGFFEELLHGISLSDPEKECELSAIARIKRLYHDARDLEQEPPSFFDLIQGLSVSDTVTLGAQGLDVVSVTAQEGEFVPFVDECGSGHDRVLFTSLEEAGSYPSDCCDVVIMTSLDSAHYNGAQKRSTLTEFLVRYHIPVSDDVLAEMEANFLRVIGLAKNVVVFEFAEQTLGGDENYPAFFLESFLNDRASIDQALDARTLGEAQFDLTARMSPVAESSITSEQRVIRGEISAQERTQLLSYAFDAEGVERPIISPSALETYRKCPYLWFVQRKLNLDDVEEGFGPREQGTFVHSVFQTFYNEWKKQGHDRVSPDNFNEAQAFFSEVFEQLVQEQATKEPGDRYVATSELERERLANLKRQLIQNIAFQRDIFSSYHVKDHEIKFTADDQVVYAGALLCGRIDRVDIDENGNFVVIDYKGSTNGHEAGYELPDAPDDPEAAPVFEAPDKIQALMYAQAYRRKYPDLHPRAAVYLSYRAQVPNDLLKGSMVETLPEAKAYSKKANVVHANFEAYLDLVEQDLVRTVERMKEGDIAPDPCDKHACTYCPVLYCEKRIDGSH